MGDSSDSNEEPPVSGSSSGSGGGSSSDDDSHQGGLDSYTGDSQSNPEDEGDEEAAAAAILAGLAGGVASASAAAGASAGAGAGAGAGTAAGTVPVPDSPDGSDGGSDTPSEDEGAGEESDSADDESDGKETGEREDTDSDDHNERDREDSDRDSDSEDEEEDDDEEDEEEAQAVLVVRADAWSHMAWGSEPVLKRVMEVYGDQVEIYHNLIPVREFDDPEITKSEWLSKADRHGMPVDPSVWDVTPPASTELSNRAFEAAVEQGRGASYLRRLRIAAIVKGVNIENKDTLCKLATDVGLDRTRFELELEQAEPATGRQPERLPQLLIYVDDEKITRHGHIHFNDLKMLFEQVDLEESEPQSLTGFVYTYGPVTTEEVMEVYQWDRERAVKELETNTNISHTQIGIGEFWQSK